MLAQHSSKSAEWGTPPEITGRITKVLGGIDLDPASDEYYNRTVRATEYYTENDSALTKSWQGRVFLNPPGGRGVPQKFFTKLCHEFYEGRVTSAIYLGYSLEQLRWIKPVLYDLNLYPMIAVPSKRIAFIGAGDSPTHGNFFLCLGNFDTRMEFCKEFSHDCLLLRVS